MSANQTPMEFTFVIQCHCGCETIDTIGVEAPSIEDAVKQLECEWQQQERNVSIVSAFKGAPEVARVPDGT
jgi:hypothetical protein